MNQPSNLASLSAKDQPDAYRTTLKSILTSHPPASLQSSIHEFIDHVLQDSLGLVQSRQLVHVFIQVFREYSKKDSNDENAEKCGNLEGLDKGDIWTYLLDSLVLKGVAYDAEMAQVREYLADIYEEAEEWAEGFLVLYKVNYLINIGK